MISNKNQFIKTLTKRLKVTPEKRVKQALFESGSLVRGTATQSIARGTKTGVTYQKYNPNRIHTASAAGEPPATDTGRLVNSIYQDTKKRGKTFVGIVGAGVDYAIHLEFGTTNMGARPFLQPALRKNRKKIINIFLKKGLIQ